MSEAFRDRREFETALAKANELANEAYQAVYQKQPGLFNVRTKPGPTDRVFYERINEHLRPKTNEDQDLFKQLEDELTALTRSDATIDKSIADIKSKVLKVRKDVVDYNKDLMDKGIQLSGDTSVLQRGKDLADYMMLRLKLFVLRAFVTNMIEGLDLKVATHTNPGGVFDPITFNFNGFRKPQGNNPFFNDPNASADAPKCCSQLFLLRMGEAFRNAENSKYQGPDRLATSRAETTVRDNSRLAHRAPKYDDRYRRNRYHSSDSSSSDSD